MTSVKEIIGMEVVTPRNVTVGKVKDVEINMSDLTIEGIIVTKGVFGNETYIWRNYLGEIKGGKIVLAIDLERLEDSDVYDRNDKKLGTISAVDGKGKHAFLTVNIPDARPTGKMGLAKPELVVSLHQVLALGPHIIIDVTKSKAEKYVNQESAEI